MNKGTMTITVEINTEDVIKSLRGKYKGIEQGLKNGIEKGAFHLEAKMVDKINSNIAPPLKEATIESKGSSLALVDTGELRLEISTQIEPGGLSAKIGVMGGRAEIAAVHEWGLPARGIPERSFMRSTWNEKKGKVEQIIAEEIKKAIKT